MVCFHVVFIGEHDPMNSLLSEKNTKNLKARPSVTESLRLEEVPVKGYERVIRVTNPEVGLTAIIALHDLTLGPALGGIRIYPYHSWNDAMEDVLRLAKGMTYKAAISEVGFGGGKSVIIADPNVQKTPELLLSFGHAVEKLGGIYICAEDVGSTVEDCRIIRRATKFVVGLPQAGSSGDPGPFTAWGVFRGIQSAAQKLFGNNLLEGCTVAMQGLGNVGSNLIQYLFWAGANLIVSDIDSAKTKIAARRYGARVVSPDEILSVECDILSPCAFGGIINDRTIPHLRCKAIAGAANNQLLRDAHGVALKERGILYAPDFVINSGGLLNVAAELEEDGYSPTFSRAKIHRIYDSLLAIYDIADKSNDSTHSAAIALCDYRIRYGIGKRSSSPVFHHMTDL
jgi:leucine dehydrogenase